jgi:hypothetical protein
MRDQIEEAIDQLVEAEETDSLGREYPSELSMFHAVKYEEPGWYVKAEYPRLLVLHKPIAGPFTSKSEAEKELLHYKPLLPVNTEIELFVWELKPKATRVTSTTKPSGVKVHETESGFWYIKNNMIHFDNSGYVQAFSKSEWHRLMIGKNVRGFALEEPGIIRSADEEHWFDPHLVNSLFGLH